jgi:hypothetical protein
MWTLGKIAATLSVIGAIAVGSVVPAAAWYGYSYHHRYYGYHHRYHHRYYAYYPRYHHHYYAHRSWWGGSRLVNSGQKIVPISRALSHAPRFMAA